MASSDSSKSSSSTGGGATPHPVKRRRIRKALSCTQCKDRKIRCDRNVPQCSSCVTRGIQHRCRWGDERDDSTAVALATTSKRSPRGVKRTKGGSDKDNGPADLDDIVEAVVERLKRGKDTTRGPSIGRTTVSGAPSISAERRSIHDLIYVQPSCPPPTASANLAAVSAFQGARIYHPIRGVVLQTDRQIDASLVRDSLRMLPRRAVFDQLIHIYLDEVEPNKQTFNCVILRQQMDEFWRGVDELGVQPDSIVALQAKSTSTSESGSDGATRMINLWFDADRCLATDPEQSFALCDCVRQGLLAVVFALIDSATRAMSLSRLKALGVIPEDTTSAQAKAYCLDLHRRSMQHLSMSDYLQHPTIWSLQTLLMQHSRWLDTPDFDRSLAMLSVAITLAVNMGLNRLGSAYNDLENMSDEQDGERGRRSDSRPFKTGFSAAAAAAVAAGRPTTSLLSDARYGASLSVFEEGDLALRELGRKVWCCLVWVDWTMAGHLDHFYSAHDGVNHTAPPAPVDDEEIVSQKAPFSLAKARMGIHRASENTAVGLRMALARAARVQTDLENQKGYILAYEEIMMVDEGFCEVIEMVPDYLQLKARREKTLSGMLAFQTPNATDHEKRLQLQTCMLQDQIHFRRLRLHRMSFGKGLKEVLYRPSVLACLRAARVILAVRHQVEEHKMRMWSTFILQSHLFHAALVLQLVLLYEMDRMRAAKIGNGARKHSRNSRVDDDAYVLDDFDATLQQLDEAVGYLQSSEQAYFSRDLLPGLSTFLSGVQEYNDRQKLAKVRAEAQAKAKAKERSRGHAAPAASTHQSYDNRNGTEQNPHTDAATILASIPMVDAAEAQWPRSASKQFPSLNPHIETTSYDRAGSASTPSTSLTSSSPHSLLPWPVVAPFGSSQQHGTLVDAVQSTGHSPSMPATIPVAAAHSAGEAYDPSIWSLEALFPDYAAGEVDLIAALERSFFGGASMGGASGFLPPDSTAFGASITLPVTQALDTQWPS